METEENGADAGDPHGARQAASLLNALERLRADLGGVADELIRLLRASGVTPPGETQRQDPERG